jgi:hypothetical protein
MVVREDFMLTLSMVTGIWIAIMLLVLPRVLAHPRAVHAHTGKRSYSQRRKPAHS